MTVKEFTMSFFTLGSKIDRLLVVQNDGKGNQLNRYNGTIGSIIYMSPEVRNAHIRTWWVDTKAKNIIVCIETDGTK